MAHTSGFPKVHITAAHAREDDTSAGYYMCDYRLYKRQSFMNEHCKALPLFNLAITLISSYVSPFLCFSVSYMESTHTLITGSVSLHKV